MNGRFLSLVVLGLSAGGAMVIAQGDDPAAAGVARWLAPELTRSLGTTPVPFVSVQAAFDAATSGQDSFTLPDSRVVGRAACLASLEDIQRGLAAQGKSLLDAQADLGVLAETVVPATELAEQGLRILASIRAHDPKSMPR